MGTKLLWGALGVSLVLALACGGAAPVECVGHVSHAGQTYQPESGVADAAQAQKNACNLYCLDADPEYEAMYQIWRSSPGGDPSVSKKDALYRSDRLLDYVTVTCAERCVSEIQAGTLQGGVSCE